MGSSNASYDEIVKEFTVRTERPENKIRQCVVEGEWNGEILECDKCGMRNPTIGVYICDFCDTSYCLICTPTTKYFYFGDTALTFCTNRCRRGCIDEDYDGDIVCKRCMTLKPQMEMQRIDQNIGDVCVDCLTI